jgi:MATE family multidrug resistance protein
MLSYSAMTLVDTIFVGRLGPASLAGVGLAGVVSFALLVFSIGLLRGVKVLVSQAIGGGRPDRAGDFLAAGLVLALSLALVTVLLGQLVALIMPALAASPAAGRDAATYLSIRILGAPLLLAYVAMRETVYGQGQARAPMVASVLANLSNIALAYLFLFHLDMGVAGVAWSTVASHAVETGVVVALRGREMLPSWRRGLPHLAAVWRMGLPNALQLLIEMGSFLLLTVLIAAMSEADMAAHQIALQAIHFSFLPALAVGEAASVMAGQAVGANRDDLVIGVARLAMWMAGTYTALCTGVLAFGAPWIASLFTTDAGVITAAVPLLYMAAAFQVADGANVVARGVLRGTGDVRFPALVGIAASWSLMPPLCWLLGHQAGLGAFGGWIGLSADILVTTAIFWWRLIRRGWAGSAVRSRAALGKAPAGAVAA